MTFYQSGYWIPDWIQIFLERIPDTGLDTNFVQSGYRIPDWIQTFEMDRIPDWKQIFVKVDTGYRIGYEICLILVDTVSGTGYMYPDIPVYIKEIDMSI